MTVSPDSRASAMSFKIGMSTHIKCYAISVIITCIFYRQVTEQMYKIFTANFLSYEKPILAFTVFMMALMIAVAFVHELLHGMSYSILGGKVKIGFKVMYFYAMEVSGLEVKSGEFMFVLLTPITLITILSLLFGDIGKIICFVNIVGSSGDACMATFLAIYGRGFNIVDRKYGFDMIQKQHGLL